MSPDRGHSARWLPGELAVFRDPGAVRPGHTARDRVADAALFAGALAFWAVEWSGYPPSYADQQPAWFLDVDPWIGLAACLALWWRRRFPVALVWALLPALLISGTATGATLAAILTVAIHRRWQVAALATAPYLAASVPFGYLNPEPGMSRPATVAVVLLMFLTPLVWGVAIRSRRQLMVSLHRDAERQRREHELRLADVRRAERERIAREMHDVLAHRISLLSVHAGALAYRTAQAETGTGPALDPAEMGEAVSVMRDNANQALTELGDVLNVLRSGDPEDTLTPQPRLRELPRLVEEARAAGQLVTFETPLPTGTGSLRPQVQRTAYRLVQEGLTNARKHAPGGEVTVRVAGAPGDGLEVEVTNTLPEGTPATGGAGAGVGLAGLAERVNLDGGTLTHGPRQGRFVLRAWLPWPHDRAEDHAGPGAARR
ncbi:sensor histidine kinase [Prauserella muralis]|uniref:histidine kinase n=1 Tax=Prauserella muralis TaxID=588067 RepID=A0A2V4BJJ7_9PSEU|nr:sensor histidine kinase [Prauserella muralis]PXY30893.1 hypothetical protein BAY60_00170 [Prauserella muralis]TWE14860.1 signal transduction histidine kinase [Prauserella muralis]